jgi:hypothetical protein
MVRWFVMPELALAGIRDLANCACKIADKRVMRAFRDDISSVITNCFGGFRYVQLFPVYT